MTHSQPQLLTWAEISKLLLVEFVPGENVSMTRIRYRNKDEIRRVVEMPLEELSQFIQTAMEDGNQPGGDLEIQLPSQCKTLVGHHDGIYWIEPLA